MAIDKGNKIKVDYEGKFGNGNVFDSFTKSNKSLAEKKLIFKIKIVDVDNSK